MLHLLFLLTAYMGLAGETIGTERLPVDVEFVILVCSYNNEKFVKKNLRSICYQKSSKPYGVIYVNDCSKDKTGQLVDEFVRKHNLHFVKVIHNETQVGAMANVYNTIHDHIADHKIVVTVDGDDWLPHSKVLLRLEEHYADPEVWLTYGSLIEFPSGKTTMTSRIPNKYFRQRRIREYPFVSVALRTYRAALFKKIKKEDFMYKGEWLKAAHDVALMWPMLEMGAPKDHESKNHSIYLPDILYVYNKVNPISDFRTHWHEQQKMEHYLRSKKPYEPIFSLFG